jgi:Mce-associated membrane protein
VIALFTRRGSVSAPDPAASAPDATPGAAPGDDHATASTESQSQATAEDAKDENLGTDEDLTDEPAVDGEQPAALTHVPRRYRRLLVFCVLPLVALAITAGAGYLKWQDASMHAAQTAAVDSLRAASDTTIKMLSYRPDTVERDLGAARDLLTGNLRNDYTSLTNQVVIPGAKQKQISAVATVPGAATVSASRDRAVVLVFVNQTVIIGSDPPTNTASSVRVTLRKQSGRWLVSSFDPI